MILKIMRSLFIGSVLMMQVYAADLVNPYEWKKTELHRHLGGSWPLRFLERIATPEQLAELNEFIDERIEVGYEDAFLVFRLINELVKTNRDVEEGTRLLCRSLAVENVEYVEIRTGLKNFEDQGFEYYLRSVLAGIKMGCSGFKMKAVVILSLKRSADRWMAQETLRLIKKYRDQGVVGLDISDISTQGVSPAILEICEELHTERIPITLHIGESFAERAEQQMRELLAIQPKRVGHAVHLCPEAELWIKERRIPVEMCLTSAVSAGMIEEASQHPALAWLKGGHPVVICTDDPLIFKADLSTECALAMNLLGYSEAQMIELQARTRELGFDRLPVS